MSRSAFKAYPLLLCLNQETKEDRLKEVDPKLLFPFKAWLRGFLPGHKFNWDEEKDFAVEDGNEMEVKTQHIAERTDNFNHLALCYLLGSLSRLTRRGASPLPVSQLIWASLIYEVSSVG